MALVFDGVKLGLPETFFLLSDEAASPTGRSEGPLMRGPIRPQDSAVVRELARMPMS